jgi:bifunctional non-homologous end joining protein LigD
MLPGIIPMPLVRISEPFNDPEWIFELKLDGFRALASVENRQCRLVSRNGHTFRRFDPLCAAIATELTISDAILDGEIVCPDEDGRSRFNPLLFRKRTPIFAAFDLLWVDGEDRRELPLIERKERLRRVVLLFPSLLKRSTLVRRLVCPE